MLGDSNYPPVRLPLAVAEVESINVAIICDPSGQPH